MVFQKPYQFVYDIKTVIGIALPIILSLTKENEHSDQNNPKHLSSIICDRYVCLIFKEVVKRLMERCKVQKFGLIR